MFWSVRDEVSPVGLVHNLLKYEKRVKENKSKEENFEIDDWFVELKYDIVADRNGERSWIVTISNEEIKYTDSWTFGNYHDAFEFYDSVTNTFKVLCADRKKLKEPISV